jgi:hypothetical protein
MPSLRGFQVNKIRLFSAFILLAASYSLHAATFAQAMASCESNLDYYHTHGHPNAVCLDNGSTRVNAWSDSSKSTLINWWAYTNPTCTGGMTLNSSTHLCECPAGQVDDNGSNDGGTCIDASSYPTCTYDQSIRSSTNTCPSGNEYTGWPDGYQCYEPSDGVITVPGCTPSCGAGQYLTSGQQCANEPTCVGGQTLNTETHTCEDPTCSGDQTFNFDTHSCDEPTCVGGQTLNTSNHTCEDPTCVGGQTFNSSTHSCDDPSCQQGYTLNPTTHSCDFSGCPVGYVSGQVNGVTQCVQSGQTTTGTQESTTTTTGTQTGTATTNPDGSQTTTTTTTQTSTGTTSITLDTGGLAQESTALNTLDELKKLTQGQAFGGASGESLYEPGGKTYAGILAAFKDRVTASPIASAGSGFFTITLSGSCPIWVLPQTALTPAIPIDMQCSDMMNDIWPLISAVVIAAASFMAFRWAFL